MPAVRLRVTWPIRTPTDPEAGWSLARQAVLQDQPAVLEALLAQQAPGLAQMLDGQDRTLLIYAGEASSTGVMPVLAAAGAQA